MNDSPRRHTGRVDVTFDTVLTCFTAAISCFHVLEDVLPLSPPTWTGPSCEWQSAEHPHRRPCSQGGLPPCPTVKNLWTNMLSFCNLLDTVDEEETQNEERSLFLFVVYKKYGVLCLGFTPGAAIFVGHLDGSEDYPRPRGPSRLGIGEF